MNKNVKHFQKSIVTKSEVNYKRSSVLWNEFSTELIDFNSIYTCDIFMQMQVVPRQARLGFLLFQYFVINICIVSKFIYDRNFARY